MFTPATFEANKRSSSSRVDRSKLIHTGIPDDSASGGLSAPTSKGSGTYLLNRPKRPLSAYNLYFRDERERLMQTLPPLPRPANGDKRKTPHYKISFADLGKTIGSRWKNLDKALKARYEAEAHAERFAYKERLEAWQKQQIALGLPVKRKNKKRAKGSSNYVKKHGPHVPHAKSTTSSQVILESHLCVDDNLAQTSRCASDTPNFSGLNTPLVPANTSQTTKHEMEQEPVPAFQCVANRDIAGFYSEPIDPFADNLNEEQGQRSIASPFQYDFRNNYGTDQDERRPMRAENPFSVMQMGLPAQQDLNRNGPLPLRSSIEHPEMVKGLRSDSFPLSSFSFAQTTRLDYDGCATHQWSGTQLR